jgi:hypothetical protein
LFADNQQAFRLIKLRISARRLHLPVRVHTDVVAKLSPPVLMNRALRGLALVGRADACYKLAVTVRLDHRDDIPLPEDQAFLLFQSVHELLINAAQACGL